MSGKNPTMLERVIGGDREALRELLEIHGPEVRSRIDREIGQVWRSQFDADDVMQVTYLEAFLQQSSLTANTEVSFVAWLRRIAMNNLRDAIKELGRQKRPHPANRVHGAKVAGTDSYVSLIHTLSSAEDTPSRHVAQDEASKAIESILQQMPADYATVIRRYDLGGEPIQQVAQSMGRSAGAVHMLRARAHERMRVMIGSETDFFSRTA